MLKNKKINLNDFINNAVAIILFCLVILFSIIVGTPLKENTIIITIITLIIFVVYIISYKLILKNKYIDFFKKINKIDILVMIICLSPLIPLIFKTYINKVDTMNVCFRYITILMIYIIAKILIGEDKKYKKIIINSIIISGIISFIIAFDSLLYNNLSSILEKIGVNIYSSQEKRMVGNFGYANTFAISMLIPTILTIDKYLKSQKKYNFIYLNILNIFIIGCILSYSRASYIIYIFSIILFCILRRNKDDIFKIINIFLITAISAIMYSKIFSDFFTNNKLITIVLLIVFSIVSSIIIELINKNKFIEKLNYKKYIKKIIFIILSISIIFLIGLKLYKPLKIYEIESDSETYKYKIINIDNSIKYTFAFDIESISKDNMYIYNITIEERDINDLKLKSQNIRLGSYKGEKILEIKPDSRTYNIYIKFNSLNKDYQQGFEIKSLKINDKEYPLNYVYLPVNLVNRIRTINIESLLKHGRIVFYKDSFKIIKNNLLTGAGGKTWNYSYKDIRSYEYTTVEVHSYPLQLWLDFGLLSVIAYVLLIIILCIKATKIRKEDYCIFVTLIIIILHSTIDFDLSFMNMLVYTYLLISIISSSNDDKKNTKYIDCTLKRTIDIIGGIIGTLLLIPTTLCLIIAKIVAKDKGPIFYTQYRIGKNGKEFKLYKYRSMVVNADEILKEYLKNNKELKKEYEECKKIQKDPRVTKIGKFIRSTNIDELPQFINVLKGDMTIVGPRPYLPQEKKDMLDNYKILITCKPGITGNWQVNKGKDNTFITRLKMDTDYINKNDFLIDIIILFKTIFIMKKGEKNNENNVGK